MGIINATPDSFYKGSRTANIELALSLANSMIQEGAAIIDIGGQSTRPNSELVSESEEIDRVVPVIEAIHKAFPFTYISIDTYYPKVAQMAVKAGASLVNDISGGRFYSEMLSTVANLNVPYICMHSTGTIDSLHEKTIEDSITPAVVNYFKERVDACNKAGIKDLILDPGFGFGKTNDQNFQLLKEMGALQIFGLPILLGVSRKSMIYKTLHISADEALNGTTVLNTIGLLNHACILRVHDVKEAVETVRLMAYLKK
ncbi:MAG: dihydropteroate synthase [Chitinophagaceae bacterium]|nr:MAG: dihydropteroate synthase [Chitinophagaceae bacterium]